MDSDFWFFIRSFKDVNDPRQIGLTQKINFKSSCDYEWPLNLKIKKQCLGFFFFFFFFKCYS